MLLSLMVVVVSQGDSLARQSTKPLVTISGGGPDKEDMSSDLNRSYSIKLRV